MLTVATPLTAEQHAKLARLHLYGTRYEIVLTLADGGEFRVAYTGRHTYAGMERCVHANGAAIAALMIGAGTSYWKAGKGQGAYMAFDNGARIAFSGRTQRDAIMEGELPRVDA